MIHALKDSIDRTGEGFLTLFNDGGEYLALGNVQDMRMRKGLLVMKWPMTNATHGANFTKAMISQKKRVLWSGEIVPTRADVGSKSFKLELDYE